MPHSSHIVIFINSKLDNIAQVPNLTKSSVAPVMTMVNINIEIPDGIHKDLKLASVLRDTTLKEYVIETLEKAFPEGR